jgi:hypothetical protein
MNRTNYLLAIKWGLIIVNALLLCWGAVALERLFMSRLLQMLVSWTTGSDDIQSTDYYFPKDLVHNFYVEGVLLLFVTALLSYVTAVPLYSRVLNSKVLIWISINLILIIMVLSLSWIQSEWLLGTSL